MNVYYIMALKWEAVASLKVLFGYSPADTEIHENLKSDRPCNLFG